MKLENKFVRYCKTINREIFSKIAKIVHQGRSTGYISAKNINLDKKRSPINNYRYINYKDGKGIERSFIIAYYVMAVYKNITTEMITELFNDSLEYEKEVAMKILLLNKNLSDDVKLWIKLQ